MLRFFEKFPEVFAIMSEKADGSMKLLDGEAWKENLKNRNVFFGRNGIDPDKVVSAKLAHGNQVLAVGNGAGKIIEGADGLVTSESGLFLAVTVSDCIPAFFYEKEKGIIGVAHAGWRGIVQGVIGNAVEKISQLGGNPKNLQVAFGPGINKCHFEIKEDVFDEFSGYPEHVLWKGEKTFVDLKGIVREQLSGIGIKGLNIEDNHNCTYCSEKLFSFRRDKTNKTMIATIGFR